GHGGGVCPLPSGGGEGRPRADLPSIHGKRLQLPFVCPVAPVTLARLPVSVTAETASGAVFVQATPTFPAPLPCTVLPWISTFERLLAWIPLPLVLMGVTLLSRNRSVELRLIAAPSAPAVTAVPLRNSITPSSNACRAGPWLLLMSLPLAWVWLSTVMAEPR